MVHRHGARATVYPSRATVNGGSTMRLTSCRGFSMVELLVALVAGLIIVGTATTLYVSIIRANATSVQLSSLNLGMQGLLDVMERDIRRAGYFANATLNLQRDANGNPVIAPTDRTAMFSRTVSAGSATLQDLQQLAVTDPLYDCILLRYDANNDGTIAGTNEIMGYRFKTAARGLEFQQWATIADQLSSPSQCADDDGWNNISQDGQVQLTAVTFAINPTSGFSIPTGQRTITVSMIGQSQQKPALSLTLQRQVRIRNDQY
jgi:prepilin-type N-terminal cleavage/methylation domain-containing protein